MDINLDLQIEKDVEKTLKKLKLIYKEIIKETTEEEGRKIIENFLKRIPTEQFVNIMIDDGIEILEPLFEDKTTGVLGFEILDILYKCIMESKKNAEEIAQLQDMLEKYISSNFLKILRSNKKSNDKSINQERRYYPIKNIKILLAYNMAENNRIKKTIEECFNLIEENIRSEDYIELVQCCKNIQGIKIDMSLDKIARKLAKNTNNEDILWAIKRILEELLKNQNLSTTDIQDIGEGASSKVFLIGDKVIKTGLERMVYKVPNHARIIQPLIRISLPYLQKSKRKIKDEDNLFVEVQNKVQNNWWEGLTEAEIDEELYRIYKELRDDGILWIDCKKENVGRLLKENKTNYCDIRGNELRPEDKAIGFYGKKTNRVLSKGKLVIIDTDYLITREDEKNWYKWNNFQNEFSKRYEEERRREAQKKAKEMHEKVER